MKHDLSESIVILVVCIPLLGVVLHFMARCFWLAFGGGERSFDRGSARFYCALRRTLRWVLGGFLRSLGWLLLRAAEALGELLIRGFRALWQAFRTLLRP